MKQVLICPSCSSPPKVDFRMTYRLTFEEQRLGVVAAAVTQVSQDLAT